MRSGVGTGEDLVSTIGSRKLGGEEEAYGDGVDVQDGHLRREVGQVAALPRLVECGFDELREVGRGLYASHIGIIVGTRDRHCSVALPDRGVHAWRLT